MDGYKLDLESYCVGCPYFNAVSETTSLYSKDGVYSCYVTEITCDRIDSCRMVENMVRKEFKESDSR